VRAGAESYLGSDSYEAHLAEAMELAGGAVDMVTYAGGIAGDHDLHTGRYDEAVGHLERTTAAVRSTPGGYPVDAPYWLVFALAAAGRSDAAAEAFDAAQEIPGLVRWHARGVVLAAAGALLAGDEGAIDAAIASATGRMPFDLALIRVLAAEVIGGPTRPRWLREALDIYEACDGGIAIDRVRGLLRGAGGAVPRRRRQSHVPPHLIVFGVTAREAEILALIEEGFSNASIADKLYVSVRTVESHVSSLLGKLSVTSRQELPRAAAAP
jgi:DNA-binding CsgD family transcriptional regulator